MEHESSVFGPIRWFVTMIAAWFLFFGTIVALASCVSSESKSPEHCYHAESDYMELKRKYDALNAEYFELRHRLLERQIRQGRE